MTVAETALPRYLEPMVFRLNRRVFVPLAVFFFALGGVLHGFAAAAMNGEMQSMAAAETSASGEACGYCGGENDMSAVSAACQAVCTSPALLDSVPGARDMRAEAHLQTAPPGAPPGRAGPPEPNPPKSVSLS